MNSIPPSPSLARQKSRKRERETRNEKRINHSSNHNTIYIQISTNPLISIHFPHNDNTNNIIRCHDALHFDCEMSSQSRMSRCLFGGRQNRKPGSQRVRYRNAPPHVQQRPRRSVCIRLVGSVQRRRILVVSFDKSRPASLSSAAR